MIVKSIVLFMSGIFVDVAKHFFLRDGDLV